MLLMSEPLMRNVCPVAKSYLTVCDIHGLRLPCPSLFPGVCSDSSPLSPWCHLPILSVTSFCSCPWSFPVSGSISMSWLFKPGGQHIGASASTSFLPMNIQGWFPLGLTSLISLLSKGLLRVFSALQFERINSSALNLLYDSTLISIWLLQETYLRLTDFS